MLEVFNLNFSSVKSPKRRGMPFLRYPDGFSAMILASRQNSAHSLSPLLLIGDGS
jgi:hypothetical protein